MSDNLPPDAIENDQAFIDAACELQRQSFNPLAMAVEEQSEVWHAFTVLSDERGGTEQLTDAERSELLDIIISWWEDCRDFQNEDK